MESYRGYRRLRGDKNREQKEGPWKFYSVNYIVFSKFAFKESFLQIRISNITVENVKIGYLKFKKSLETRNVYLQFSAGFPANVLPCRLAAIPVSIMSLSGSC